MAKKKETSEVKKTTAKKTAPKKAEATIRVIEVKKTASNVELKWVEIEESKIEKNPSKYFSKIDVAQQQALNDLEHLNALDKIDYEKYKDTFWNIKAFA